MFVAHAQNTMRNARHALPKEPVIVVDIVELRQRRVAEAQAELALRNRQLKEVIHRQRVEANLVIKQANMALARYHRAVSMDVVVRRICRVTGISLADIMSERRSRDISFARQAIFYWACRLTKRSLPDIGRFFDRDHTTVLHGKRAYPAKRAAMGRYVRPLDRSPQPGDGTNS